jgi:hypothetical protein
MLERYGHWTVLDPDGSYRAHDKVPCRCDCGMEREVPKYKLTQGRSKSCGCLRGERLRGLEPPNLAPECDSEVRVGSRHGRWTALTEPYSDPAYPNRIALSRCDCGVQRPVVAHDLVAGNSKSCGCLRRDSSRVRSQTLGPD